MSKAPQNLPKRTRVLVKDILFQEKYRLTHTQMDIMSYIINALVVAFRWNGLHPDYHQFRDCTWKLVSYCGSI